MLNDAQLTAVGKHIALALDTPDAAITDIRRFHGGASRETYAIDVAAGDIRHALILRCDPGDSLIDTPRALEFAAYKSAEDCGIPVPHAVSLCEDPALIGTPFFIMKRSGGNFSHFLEKSTGSMPDPAPLRSRWTYRMRAAAGLASWITGPPRLKRTAFSRNQY